MLNKSTNFACDKFVFIVPNGDKTLQFYNYGRKKSN